MWPIILSNRLPIVALVGRYPANKLMGRGLIPARKLASRGLLSPHCKTRAYPVLSTVSSRYSSCRGRLSTRYSPVRHSTRGRSPFRVRLACVKHAASVQSEPESNSPVQICSRSLLGRNQNLKVVLFPFALRLSMNQARRRNGAKGRMPFCLRTVNSFLKIFQKALAKHWASFRRRRKLVFLRLLPVNSFFQIFFRSPSGDRSGLKSRRLGDAARPGLRALRLARGRLLRLGLPTVKLWRTKKRRSPDKAPAKDQGAPCACGPWAPP